MTISASQLMKSLSKKKTLLIVAAISFLMMLSGMCYIYSENRYEINCNSNFTVVNHLDKNKVLHLRARYNEFGNELRVRFEGVMLYGDVETSVSRIITFKTRKIGGIIYLKTLSVLISNADHTDGSILEEMLPVFYSKENTEGSFYLYKQDNGDYVFATGSVPSFYCSRS
ncbi:hypothetical protein PGN61_23175 [Klebsiella aerogenes]